MDTIFTIAATLGGTVLVIQFVLLLTGLGAHGDAGGEVGHFDPGGGEVGHGVPHAGGAASHAPAAVGHASEGVGSLLGYLRSVRAIAAGMAFFGLGGRIGLSSGWSVLSASALAITLGAAAAVAVAVVMRALFALQRDGTLQIGLAVGCEATVDLSIPPRHEGRGKVVLHLQGRTVDYPATTAFPEALANGSRVVVVGVGADRETLEVIPAAFDRRSSDA